MGKAILVLKGRSLYNVLRLAADIMIDSFKNMGYQVAVLDLLDQEDCDRFEEALKEEYDLLFSFQALLYNETVNESQDAFWGQYKNMFTFGHIVDHPLYHYSRLETNHGDNMYVGCIDRNHVEYINTFCKGVKNAIYFPHAGFKAKNIISYEKRTLDLFFPCSYTSPGDIWNEIKGLEEVYQGIAEKLIQQMLSTPMLTLQDALVRYFQSVNFTYTEEEFHMLIGIFDVVDKYIRAYTRDRLIRAVLDGGINLTVCGRGWNEFELLHHPNLNFVGESGMDFLETIEMMANSKFVLNHIPTLQCGMHERIFTSMRCGAVCITNDFPIVHEEFTDGENILLYSQEDLDSFVGRVKFLLNYPGKSKSIAEKGNAIAEDSHKWEDNGVKILDLFGL